MKVSIREFKALRPIVEPDLLSVGEATTAENCVVESGALVPLRSPTPVLTLPGAQAISIYRFGQNILSDTNFWFQATVDVDFVKGPVDNDTEERTYWAHGVGAGVPPYKTNAAIATSAPPYPSAVFEMGVAPPTLAPLVGPGGTPTNADDAAESRVYCYTLVTGWGEESAPSPVSNAVSIQPGQFVFLQGFLAIPSGNYNYASKRLYRSASGSSSTQFQFVAELPLFADTFTDTAAASALGEVLTTRGWLPPPSTLSGLTAMANGIMAGFTGNTVCFSVPYVPYAWPVAYQLSVDAPVVGIAAFDQSLFIGTTRGIYVATGSDPTSMTLEKLAVKQSCVAKRSIVPMLGGVVWASPDGLCFIGNSGFKLLTDNLLSRQQWQAYNPGSISAWEYDNKYLMSYAVGGVVRSLLFDLGAQPTLTTTDIGGFAGFRDSASDALYLLGGSNVLYKHNTGPARTMTWCSGAIRTPSDRPWACARVVADAYPVTFAFVTDAGTFTATVTSRYAFRLPPGRTNKFQLLVQGTSTIREISVADSMKAMAEDG